MDQRGVCHMLAVPYPSRGHINPMMNLCKLLVCRNPDMLLTFVVTEEWLHLLGSEPMPQNIRFGIIPNVFTCERDRFGDYSPNFFEEVQRTMESPLEHLIDSLPSPPLTTIIFDTYLIFVVGIGNRRHIPLASFWTMPALVYSLFHHFDLLVQNHHFPIDLMQQGEDLVTYVPGVSPIRVSDLPTCFYGRGREILHPCLEAIFLVSKVQYLVLVSIYELEDQIIDSLRAEIPVPIYLIGPPIPYLNLNDQKLQTDPSFHQHLKWLNSQLRCSVLYVSQGSMHSASKAQLDELAAGLRISGVRYFWVARRESSRLKDDCGEMGMIVPWCDQLKVLCHPSIGGFWSHCGWNSTSEAIFAGVPMLGFPIYWDQTSNCKQVVEDWKMGWRVMSEQGKDHVVRREDIAMLVQKFMDLESQEGKAIRQKAREASGICRRAIEKGGSSDKDLDAFVRDISHCSKQRADN